MLKLFLSSLVALLVSVSVAGEFTKIPNISNLQNDEKREIFHYEHIIVVRDSRATDDKVRRCLLINVYFVDEKEEALSQLKKLLNIGVKEVLMDKMMSLKKDCDSVDDDINQESKSESDSSEKKKSLSLHILVPRTKWCGSGNIAKNYYDLGKIHNVDRCCRSHDNCPIYIRSKDTKYKLTNNALYTTSHCRCDEALHDCLKEVNSLTAALTGRMFFNVLHMKCIVGLPENTNENMQIVSATRQW